MEVLYLVLYLLIISILKNSYRRCISVFKTIEDLKLLKVIIPGGFTRAVQTCDVVWNSPLKAHIRQSWGEWMKNGPKTFTKGGRMRTMTKNELVDNIVAAWSNITPDMIKNSFEICGQVLDYNPDRILCMREGNSCHEALSKLKTLLQYPSERLDFERLVPVAPGEVQ